MRVLMAALMAAALAAPAAAADDRKAPDAGPPGIVLVTIDSLRADRLGCYTGGSRSTPAIDALAASGIRFDRAYTASPSTAPANASVLTGLYPARHGLRHDLGGHLADGVTTLAARLAKAGYATGAVVGSSFLDSDRGLDRGFGSYADDMEGLIKLVAGRSRERRADEVVRTGFDFLDTVAKGRPFFLWLNMHDPGYDYEPPPDLAEQFESEPYAGEVANVDRQIAVLLKGLRQRGLNSTTHVILAGSHGEGLGDHDETGHGIYLFETTIRVPLIVAPAEGFYTRGRSVDRLVSLVDLGPTILELAGAGAASGLDGISLVPLLRGGGDAAARDGAGRRRLFVEAVQPRQAYGWSPLFAVIEGNRKIVQGGRLEAFDLDADGGEARPITPAPRWSDELEAFGRPLLGSFEVSEETRRRIQAQTETMQLPWANSPFCLDKQLWPDPRDPDRVAINDALYRARVDLAQGIVGRAYMGVEPLLETDPANYTVLETLIFVALKNRWRSVVPENLEIFQCNYPFRGGPYHYLGHYYELFDRQEKALEAYRLFGELEPWEEEAEYDIAVLRAAQGDLDDAFAHLERAIGLGATDFGRINRDPRLAPLWDDPRYTALVGPPPPHGP